MSAGRERLRALGLRLWQRQALALGAAGGAAAGVLYTVQSSRHMVVGAPHDRLIIGAMLAASGAGIGWLAGAALRAPAASHGDAQS